MLEELDKIAIVVQGPSINTRKIKEIFNGYNLIFSTWEGSENLYSKEDNVIFNKIPEYKGPMNFNLQKITTLNGIEDAINKGYGYVFKIRQDIIPTNFINFISNLDKDKINMFSWKNHEVYPNCPGYLTDHLMLGRSHDLYSLWDIGDMSWNNVPEIHITQQYITKLLEKVDIRFFINDLGEHNDFHWIKYNKFLSWFKNMSQDGSLGTHICNDSKHFLTKDYIKFL